MKVYHYAKLDDWFDIKNGSYTNDHELGLSAKRRIGSQDLEAWKTGAVFALLEPLPDNWVKNKDFKGIWKYFLHDMGRLLLEIEVDPEKDEVFVVDRGHVEGALYKDKKNIPEQYLHASRQDGEHAYMESKISLQEYLKKANELNWSMPEVIFLKDVPLEKIRISEQQPLLEEELKKGSSPWEERMIRQIENIPELSPWYERYKRETERAEKEKTPLGKKLR
jgi:hypothetical protein